MLNPIQYPLTTLFSLLLAYVLANILKQLFFQDPHRPPVVWHWIPKLGSTIDYGQDPYKFFFKCQEKVRFAASTVSLHSQRAVI